MELTWEQLLAHVTGGQPIDRAATPEITEQIRMEMPAYLWIYNWDDGCTRTVICDGCHDRWTETKERRRWPVSRKQGEQTTCPRCGGNVTAKHLSRGGAIHDRLDVVWYQKSAVEPGTVVAVAAHCTRDTYASESAAPWNEEINVSVRGAAVFRCGNGWTRWQKRSIWESGSCYGFNHREEWKPTKNMGNMAFGYGATIFSRIPRAMLADTFEQAIRDTPFEEIWSSDYEMLHRGKDGVEAMCMIAQYPCIEYMTKLGMTDLLGAKLEGSLPNGTVNWRGGSIEKVLKLPRQRWGELKAAKITLDVRLLIVLQTLETEKLHCRPEDAQLIARLTGTAPLNGVRRQLTDVLAPHCRNRRKKALKYIVRTARAETARGNRLRLSDFTDYWEQCGVLGANLNDDAAAFPAAFAEAHDRTTARIRTAADAKLSGRIEDRVTEWQDKFGFSFGGLTLRPARDAAEVIREGEVLNHCVGGYVRRYAEGHTVICVLRRDVEPDAPWRTVEITPYGHVIQDRGYKNDMVSLGAIPLEGHYREALDLFWQAWKERKTA